MEENSAPSKPPIEFPENPDTEALLRNIFQELLEKPQYPENVAINLKNNNVECLDTKDTAINALKIAEESLLNLYEIQKVEEKLMLSKAKYLLQEAKVKDNTFEKEKVLLNKKPLFPSSDSKSDIKYNLIKNQDLLPHNLKKCIDFTLNSNIHECKPCKSIISLEEKNKLVSNDISYKYSKTGIKDNKITTKKARNLKGQNPFKVNIGCVVFNNYHLNVNYKKKILIQNITNKLQKFIIEEKPKSKNFEVNVEDENGLYKIPPGMSAVFIIKFKTDVYLDVQDSFAIKPTSIKNTEKLEVKLTSYRDAPHLFLHVLSDRYPLTINSSHNFDVSRSIALNNTVDCGSIFSGTKKTVHLIIKNCGGPGSFFLMNEENWFQHYVNNLNIFSEIKIDDFILSPVYFEIGTNDFIVIDLEYCAKEKGMNSERVWILCDNITFEVLDLVADGVNFDQYSIKIDGDDLLPNDFILKNMSNDNETNLSQHDEISVKAEDEVANPDITTNVDNLNNFDQNKANKIQSSSTSLSLSENLSNTVLTNSLSKSEIDKEEIRSSVKTKQFALYFDNVFPFKNSKKVITVYSECPIALESEWRFSTSSTLNITNEFEKLKPEHVNFDKKLLLPYKNTDFDIILNIDFADPGIYFINLNFYVTSIPNSAIVPTDFIVLPKEDELVDVLVAEVNIVCCVKEIIINIFPEIIEVNLNYKEIYEDVFKIRVISEEDEFINGVWLFEDTDRIKVEPTKFSAWTNYDIEFKLIIENNSYDDFNDSITLVIENVLKKTLTVIGESEKPYLRAEDETYYDFGLIEVNNVYSKKMRFLGGILENFEWVLWEEESAPEDDFKSNTAQLFSTTLENGDVEFEYKINAMEEISWTMTYIVTSYYRNKVTNVTKFTFKFEITKLAVLLHTPFSQCPILCPNDSLFINQPQKFQLCLHNVSSINTIFSFEKACGDQSGEVKIVMSPKSGFLRAESYIRVDIEVTALLVGVLKEVYIPCHFKNYQHPDMCAEYNPIEPISLSLLCLVEDIIVHVTIPISNAEEKIIYWPPKLKKQYSSLLMVSSGNDLDLDLEMGVLEEQEDVIFVHEPNEVSWERINKSSIKNSTEGFWGEDKYDRISGSHEFVSNEITDHVNQQIIDEEDTADDNSISDLESTLSDEISLRNYLGDQFVFQENVLEFHNVPLREMMKKTIKIENLTTVCADINIKIKNFPPLKVEIHKVDEILCSLNLIKLDKLEAMVGNSGIFVTIEKEYQALKANETVKIDISVYANTWGIYYDELCITIGDIPPLYINLLIEIVGNPLEFPISINNKNDNILRFGVISYTSNPVSRKVYVKNTSNIPLCIIWHVFMKDETDGDPFQILFDVYHPDVEKTLSKQESFGKLTILGPNPKVRMMTNSEIFKLEKSETYLKPQSTSWVEVTLEPSSYMDEFNNIIDIKAYLIGYLYLSETFREKVNYFKRKQGSELKPVKMKLMVSLELPKVKLELFDSTEELSFVLYATDILHLQEYKEKKKILLKNDNKCPIYFYASTEEPLKILKTNSNGEKNINYNYEVVNPGESVEIYVLLIIKKEKIIKASNALFSKERDDVYNSTFSNNSTINNNCLILNRRVKLYQRGYKTQTIPMPIRIYFPQIETTREIDFGIVFIGNVKKELLTLKNRTACSINFQVSCENEDFQVVPTEGTLSPGKLERPSIFDVSVLFLPSVYKLYTGEIKVTTELGNVEIVKFSGITTHNESKCVPNYY